MKIDTHVHTHHSNDSTATMEEYCGFALDNGIDCLCFTDHIDFNKNDTGYGFYDTKAFFNEYNSTKEKYCKDLKILCGLEFSEPHCYKREFENQIKNPYDFIIGSVHYWYKDMFPSDMVEKNVSLEVAYENYWSEIASVVSFGGFDSLGHIDFPKRYYKDLIWNRPEIEYIMKLIVKNGISLEINTSSLRKGLTETMPSNEFLEIYHSVGGQFVTVGADAHYPCDLAADNEYAKKLISSNNLIEVYYDKRLQIKL